MRAHLTSPLGVALCFAAVPPVLAQQPETVAQVLRALRSQGYHEIWFERTLLNRVRITAETQDSSREIVIDPRTGEILRDLSRTLNGDVADDGADAILSLGEDKASRDNVEPPREERGTDDAR
jgi:hypothetical protein